MPPDVRSEKVVSTKYRFIYIGIPKAATRSVLAALVVSPSHDFGGVVVREPTHEILEANPQYGDFVKFTFVRNPWARVVSAYNDKIVNANPDKIRAILSKFPDHLEPGMPFESFVEFLCSPIGSDEQADRHWLSQHRFISDDEGDLLVDRIGRSEELDTEFERLTSDLGLPEVRFERLNTRTGWRPDPGSIEAQDAHLYRNYYDTGMREAIGQRYERDIELFGYVF